LVFQYYLANHQRWYSALTGILLGVLGPPLVAFSVTLSAAESIAAASITWVFLVAGNLVLAKVMYASLVFREVFARLKVRIGADTIPLTAFISKLKARAINEAPDLDAAVKRQMMKHEGRLVAAGHVAFKVAVAVLVLGMALFAAIFRGQTGAAWYVLGFTTSLLLAAAYALRFTASDT
jgi:hypothetical protein